MGSTQRVNFYIDGFNFYFGLRSKNWRKYYWLDMVKFCQSFLKPGQQLNKVYYFTAIQSDQGKKDRQDLLFTANKLQPEFVLILGKFIRKTIHRNGFSFPTFEEKQTDVNIAVQMIRSVIKDENDISILITADSDLIPPVLFLREFAIEHKIFCFFPPNRYSADLQQNVDAVLNLSHYEQRFKQAILPDKIILKNGYVVRRPSKWT